MSTIAQRYRSHADAFERKVAAEVPIPEGAWLQDRLLGLIARDPRW